MGEEKMVPIFLGTSESKEAWKNLLLTVPDEELVGFMINVMQSNQHSVILAYAEFSDLSDKGAEDKASFLKNIISEEALQDIPDEDYIETLAEILEHHLSEPEREKYRKAAGRIIEDAIEEGFGEDECFGLSMLAENFLNE